MKVWILTWGIFRDLITVISCYKNFGKPLKILKFSWVSSSSHLVSCYIVLPLVMTSDRGKNKQGKENLVTTYNKLWKWQLELGEMLLLHLKERTDKMRLIYAEYNPHTNSIDVTTFENYILRIDCNSVQFAPTAGRWCVDQRSFGAINGQVSLGIKI